VTNCRREVWYIGWLRYGNERKILGTFWFSAVRGKLGCKLVTSVNVRRVCEYFIESGCMLTHVR